MTNYKNVAVRSGPDFKLNRSCCFSDVLICHDGTLNKKKINWIIKLIIHVCILLEIILHFRIILCLSEKVMNNN